MTNGWRKRCAAPSMIHSPCAVARNTAGRMRDAMNRYSAIEPNEIIPEYIPIAGCPLKPRSLPKISGALRGVKNRPRSLLLSLSFFSGCVSLSLSKRLGRLSESGRRRKIIKSGQSVGLREIGGYGNRFRGAVVVGIARTCGKHRLSRCARCLSGGFVCRYGRVSKNGRGEW